MNATFSPKNFTRNNTPGPLKIIQKVGIALAAVSGAIVATTAALPATILVPAWLTSAAIWTGASSAGITMFLQLFGVKENE